MKNKKDNYIVKLPSTLESNLKYLLKHNDLSQKDWFEFLKIIDTRLNDRNLEYKSNIPVKRPKNFYKIEDKEILKTRVRISSAKRYLKEFASKIKLEDYKELVEIKINNSEITGNYQKKLDKIYENYEKKFKGTNLIKFYPC